MPRFIQLADGSLELQTFQAKRLIRVIEAATNSILPDMAHAIRVIRFGVAPAPAARLDYDFHSAKPSRYR